MTAVLMHGNVAKRTRPGQIRLRLPMDLGGREERGQIKQNELLQTSKHMQKLNKISLVVTDIHICHSNTKGTFNNL